jgi:hypothetical protein
VEHAPVGSADVRECDVTVSAPPSAPFVVEVTWRCRGERVIAFEPNDPRLLEFVVGPKLGVRPSLVPAGAATSSYRVDLGAMAERFGFADVARQVGGSLIAATSSFLFTPVPKQDGAAVRVYFDPPTSAESGLRLVQGAHLIESHELRVATYTTFGTRSTRRIALGGQELRVVLLDGEMALPFDTLADWVAEAAQGVADFYGRVPDHGQLVVLEPLPKSSAIPFGKLLPESGPGIVLLVGERASPSDLYEDWVLVHELFHVGTPSFLGEGKWFDEGLATYFEPLIRARLGWISERDGWSEFVRDMPRGLEVLRTRGLEQGRDFGDTYWGGAIFCLLADLEVRRITGGERGLEDGLRQVLREGGSSSEVWTLDRALSVADSAFPMPVLRPLARRHAARPAALDLDEVFARLGLSRLGDDLSFDDQAPLVALQRRIVFGSDERVASLRSR